jgi:hypothetical protein
MIYGVAGAGEAGRPTANHRVARYECGELFLSHLLAAGQAARDDEVADVRGRIEHTKLDAVLERDPELGTLPRHGRAPGQTDGEAGRQLSPTRRRLAPIPEPPPLLNLVVRDISS